MTKSQNLKMNQEAKNETSQKKWHIYLQGEIYNIFPKKAVDGNNESICTKYLRMLGANDHHVAHHSILLRCAAVFSQHHFIA